MCMESTMKKYIFLILLLSLILGRLYFSAFVPKDVTVTISNINENGGAKISEDINFLLTTPQDKQKYELTLNKNDIASWASTTGLKTIKYYIDPSKLKITNLRVTPYPLKTYSSTYGGKLTIEYFVSPLINETTGKPINNYSLFEISKYKPRTTRYKLNTNLLNFKRTSRGDIILDEHETLIILLPDRAIIYGATPSPKGIDFKPPMILKKAEWQNQVLVKFSFVFDIEKGISSEITEGIKNIINKTIETVQTNSGILIILMIIVIIISIFLIKKYGDVVKK